MSEKRARNLKITVRKKRGYVFSSLWVPKNKKSQKKILKKQNEKKSKNPEKEKKLKKMKKNEKK